MPRRPKIMIGLKRGTVKLLPHSSEWDKLFESEKVEILKALGEIVLDVQHIGSTAIPNILAKPIIDIAILVKSLEDVEKYIGKLAVLSYQKKEENRPERMFFTKGPEENRVVYLHIGDINSDYFSDMVSFRDYLLQNSAEAEKYNSLKIELAKKFSDNREAYTEEKKNFIQEILNKIKNF